MQGNKPTIHYKSGEYWSACGYGTAKNPNLVFGELSTVTCKSCFRSLRRKVVVE